ncbi:MULTISPECIES: LppX_LprAFG lipoprotein [unclassified Amycolatopsis]|uniref:LppX_LprAFG lipoprotein n=1 Tax=unclassified Amycolatopsis TaxID=2618356 RepID=UPI0028753261|nr:MULTISPECIES: LppX_LprAFG lipoprotein [unclassified Amycolatopsis]MDS0134922.1 LppX_LprAFG lipoprotein [Amycolatopsis sp. 505]MDS0148750.1 LppX_LprAFG lipoprotein [Amycolatopsis sp. CM201R]
MSRLALLLLALLLTAGCTGSPDTRGPFPAGADLVREAATSFAAVRGVHFAAGVNGVLPGFPLRQIEGDATLDDGESATGTADVQDGDGHTEFRFIVNGTHVDTGTEAGPLPDAYTVSRFLGPHGGLKRLLDGVTDAKTEGRENVDGAPALRVGGKVPANVAYSVLAQVHADLTVKIWVADDGGPRRFVRLWVQVPPAGDHLSPVMIELSLTNQQQ